MESADFHLFRGSRGSPGLPYSRAADARRNPTAGRVSRPARYLARRGEGAARTRRPGRPSAPWTPARKRRLLRLWLCTHDLNMTQICALLKEEDFQPKETATYQQLNSLLSALEDVPAGLRPDDRAAMRTRLQILRQARTKAAGQRRPASTVTAAPAQMATCSSISAPWQQQSAMGETARPEGGGSCFPARTSFLAGHSAATCQRILEVARSSRTSSWFGDVASLLSGLTRASSTATHRSSAASTRTWRMSGGSSSAATAPRLPEPEPEPEPRLSEDSLRRRSTSDSEQPKKPGTAAQVATFLSNKAVAAKCCSGHVAQCCAAGDLARLCVHQRLRNAIQSVLQDRQAPRRPTPPFMVTKLEVNTRDALGNTLLHVAAAWGAPLSVLVDMLKRSDNVSTINNNGETFLHVFQPCAATTTAAGFRSLVSYLSNRCFNFRQLDVEARTCLSRLVALPTFPLGALSSFFELPNGAGRFFLEHVSRRGERLRHAICRRLNDQKLAVPHDDADSAAEAGLARHWARSLALETWSGPGSHAPSPSTSPPPPPPPPYGAEQRRDGFLNLFIRCDFQVNHQGSVTGRTPLMMLLARLQPGQQLCGRAELALAKLLHQGARLDVRDYKGDTALHYAARLGLPSVVKLLCAHGADVNAANHRALTPFHLAQQGLRDPRDLLSSPRMAVRFMQCATILAENAAVQTPPPPMPWVPV
jgi:ankyrin repeat protein